MSTGWCVLGWIGPPKLWLNESHGLIQYGSFFENWCSYILKGWKTPVNDRKAPAAVNCRGMKEPAAVNCRWFLRQLTPDAILLQIWQKLSHPLLLSFYPKISNLSQNLSKKPNQIYSTKSQVSNHNAINLHFSCYKCFFLVLSRFNLF